MSTSSIDFANLHVNAPSKLPQPVSSMPDYVADMRQYRRIYCLCFAIFLLIALACRVLPRAWQPFAADGAPRASLMDEVRNAVSSVLPFVFMA